MEATQSIAITMRLKVSDKLFLKMAFDQRQYYA